MSAGIGRLVNDQHTGEREHIVRVERFGEWITGLARSNAGQVQVQTWDESGITQQPGWEHTAGLTLTSPAGGTIDIQWVHGRAGGDRRDEAEKIVEGEPPAPVEPVVLAPAPDGRISAEQVEAWLAALITNSGSREVAKVTRYSHRRADPNAPAAHKYGITVDWHSRNSVYGGVVYMLRQGERRSEGTLRRVVDAV
jgi:hypothetical protein